MRASTERSMGSKEVADMSLPDKSGQKPEKDESTFGKAEAESVSRLQTEPYASDVRALSRRDDTNAAAYEPVPRTPAMAPPPFGMLRILDELETYTDELPLDTAFWSALRAGDASEVMKWLLGENARMRRELSSAESNFDEIKGMNVNAEAQLTAALAEADDIRLLLTTDLERANDRITELEEEVADYRLRWESEAERLQSAIDALTSENDELRERLARLSA